METVFLSPQQATATARLYTTVTRTVTTGLLRYASTVATARTTSISITAIGTGTTTTAATAAPFAQLQNDAV